MKTKKAEATRTIKLDLEIDPEIMLKEPQIEGELPDITERLGVNGKKEEASRPLYLIRYE